MKNTITDHKKGNIRGIVIVLLLIAVITATVIYTRYSQQLQTSATNEDPKIVLAPNQGQLPTTLKVYVDPGQNNQVVFAKVKLAYPKDQLVVRDAKISGSKFKNPIVVTNNDTTGEITLIAGVDPSDSPITQTAELATLNFDQSGTDVSPTTDNVQVITSGSQIVALPRQELTNVLGFGSRLFSQEPGGSNANKSREQKNLGLTLAVKKNAGGKDVIEASWPNIDSLEKPNFLHFTIVPFKNGGTSPAQGSSERRVQASECQTTCTRVFSEVSLLSPGSYYVNLRAVFKQKIAIQNPKQFFTVNSDHNITLSN